MRTTTIGAIFHIVIFILFIVGFIIARMLTNIAVVAAWRMLIFIWLFWIFWNFALSIIRIGWCTNLAYSTSNIFRSIWLPLLITLRFLTSFATLLFLRGYTLMLEAEVLILGMLCKLIRNLKQSIISWICDGKDLIFRWTYIAYWYIWIISQMLITIWGYIRDFAAFWS